MFELQIDGYSLVTADVVRVARGEARVTISRKAKQRVRRSRSVLEKLVKEDSAIYGVNTGFGELSTVRIPDLELMALQTNLIRSHSAGVGEPLNTETVRALMLLRANALAKGYSGIRIETLETLVEMLNKGVHPIIPSKGSVGASGDLAPLSHMILVLMGEGKAEYKGKIIRGKDAMHKAGTPPVRLDFKEGIALNNGTQAMTAVAALAVYDAENLIRNAEIAAALTLEALLGISDAFDERVHRVRPHYGQAVSAQNIRMLIRGSELVSTGREVASKDGRPQDPYSLRCTPQVLGAARDAVAYAKKVVETEINSATDNPLIFVESGSCLSGGNFHGQPVSLAMDVLGIALAMVGNMSERRTARMLDSKLSNGLPPFLIPQDLKAGLHNGLMTAQYTASALASENKILAHPACVDSIPTSANFEDFVSMGTTAAHKARQILENTEYVVGVELACAAQAAEYRGVEKLGTGTRAACETIRKTIPALKEDRVLSDIIEGAKEIVKKNVLVDEVRKAVKIE